MESPYKRQRTMPPELTAQNDFVPLDGGDDSAFAPGDLSLDAPPVQPLRASREPRADRRPLRSARNATFDSRNVQDKPKSKHALPGYEPWVLVKTKFKRRFVYNTETKVSLWRTPDDVSPGVKDFERWEKDQNERNANAKWAEEQLKEMRENSKAQGVNKAADAEGRSRRRRSESLQREDEAALMAELAAQAEHAEEQDAREAVKAVEALPAQHQPSYDSDSSYEEVEVTDSEGEEHEDRKTRALGGQTTEGTGQEDAPVEFGEDDIAYQLAAMGEDYNLEPEEYGDDHGDWEEGAEGLPLSDEDAVSLFRDLLDDYRISPFTPWEKIISDESPMSILIDDRYTVLPNMRARKDVFDIWARDKAAQLKLERAAMEKQDPRIPYLAFLHEKATPKLYWPEFKRKFKREAELNDRKLGDKDREKLYRDHLNRIKLPESTRKADLLALLKAVPLKLLNKDTRPEALPQQVLSHLHYISLPSASRDAAIEDHIRKLPPAPEADDMTDEQRMDEDKKREEHRRRKNALAERERRVEEERRAADKEGARARRELEEEERQLHAAMSTSNRFRGGGL